MHLLSSVSSYVVVSFSWSSDGQYCRVVKEGDNYVECACSHLSIYAAMAEFASLASYNEAFYASGFICISGSERARSVSTNLLNFSVQFLYSKLICTHCQIL